MKVRTILIPILAFLVVVGTVGAITMDAEELKYLFRDSESIPITQEPLTCWENERLKGVTVGNEYISSTTPYYEGWQDQSIFVGRGALGSVVITKAGDLEFLLVDATTTPNAIDGFATTTKTLAAFSASSSAGTYVFDTPFNDGLAIEVISGTLGTSTITYRR